MFLEAWEILQDKVNVYEEETEDLQRKLSKAVWLLCSLEYLKGS